MGDLHAVLVAVLLAVLLTMPACPKDNSKPPAPVAQKARPKATTPAKAESLPPIPKPYLPFEPCPRESVLVTKADLAPLHEELFAAVKKNQTQKCPAEQAFLELLKVKGGVLSRCYEYVDQNPTAAAEEFQQRCENSIGQISRVVRLSGQKGCSPFALGRRPIEDFSSLVNLGRAIALLGQNLAKEGKVRQAVELCADYLQLTQNISRGPTGLLLAMVGVSGFDAVFPRLALVLSSAEQLNAADLDAIGARLDALVESEVHPRDFFWGERLFYGLYYAMPYLQPQGWVPPGGWPPEDMVPRAKAVTAKERCGIALSWLAFAAVDQQLKRACPKEATAKRCFDGVVEIHKKHQARGKPTLTDLTPPKIARWALKKVGFDKVQKAPNQELLQKMRSDAQTAMEGLFFKREDVKYLKRHLWRIAGLQALRFVVQLRKARLEKKCPTAAQLNQAPFKELAQSAKLGDTLRIEVAQGKYSVYAPRWLGGQGGKELLILRADCVQ